MSSALKLRGDFDPARDPASQGFVPLAATEYWADRASLRSEADFFQGVQALHHMTSPLEFSMEELLTGKESFLRQVKSRIDPIELGEQLEEIFAMITRRKCLSVVTGPPGAAKSTIASLWARVVRNKYEDIPILVLTQEKTALERLQDKIALPNTTAWLMEDALKKTAPWPSKAAIIIDEAGLFSTETLARLLRRAQEIGAVKIILIGDDKQLVSDAPGQPFRWLCEQVETDRVVLAHSFRQKNLWLRQAVQALYQNDPVEALRLMPSHFTAKEEILPQMEEVLKQAIPENTLVIAHGAPHVATHLTEHWPDFRVLSLAAAQGLAIDRVILVIGQPINLAELLVGCSRQRHDLDLFIDTGVYNDAAHFAETIQPYPKNLMALDVIAATELLQIVDQA